VPRPGFWPSPGPVRCPLSPQETSGHLRRMGCLALELWLQRERTAADRAFGRARAAFSALQLARPGVGGAAVSRLLPDQASAISALRGPCHRSERRPGGLRLGAICWWLHTTPRSSASIGSLAQGAWICWPRGLDHRDSRGAGRQLGPLRRAKVQPAPARRPPPGPGRRRCWRLVRGGQRAPPAAGRTVVVTPRVYSTAVKRGPRASINRGMTDSKPAALVPNEVRYHKLRPSRWRGLGDPSTAPPYMLNPSLWEAWRFVAGNPSGCAARKLRTGGALVGPLPTPAHPYWR